MDSILLVFVLAFTRLVVRHCATSKIVHHMLCPSKCTTSGACILPACARKQPSFLLTMLDKTMPPALHVGVTLHHVVWATFTLFAQVAPWPS
jgi:hypothetical protein